MTRIEYQDDTYEAYGYDQWQNKTYYRDSEGGCIRYVYDNHHNLEEKSVLAAGALSWGGDVTAEEDMAGSIGTGKWIRERYSYDRYGRLHYKEDANGNRTSYRYAEGHLQKLSQANMYPEVETSPEGSIKKMNLDLTAMTTGASRQKKMPNS